MNISEYDDADMTDDSYLGNGISGFEIAYASGTKTPIKQKHRSELNIKKKFDVLKENRLFIRESKTRYSEWEH